MPQMWCDGLQIFTVERALQTAHRSESVRPLDSVSKLSIKQLNARRAAKNYRCPVDECNEMVRLVRQHLTIKHKLIQYTCDICKKICATAALLL